jgi:hypothetical protein
MKELITTLATTHPFCTGFTVIFLLATLFTILQTFMAGLYKNTISCAIFAGIIIYAWVQLFPGLSAWLDILSKDGTQVNAFIYFVLVGAATAGLDALSQFGHNDERIYSFSDLW